jgi:hypothetical protein
LTGVTLYRIAIKLFLLKVDETLSSTHFSSSLASKKEIPDFGGFVVAGCCS